jgi:toxin-antitoxin system PIN domain toxin
LIIPDINLLLYATFTTFPLHDRARAWWEGTLNGAAPVGLVAPVLFGFARIATNRRIFDVPMTVHDAAGHIEEWLARPQVTFLPDSARHVQVAFDLLRSAGAAGNLTTDAQIAAHAVISLGTVHTHDTDFGRFERVRFLDPL